jgi:hypothetical protein
VAAAAKYSERVTQFRKTGNKERGLLGKPRFILRLAEETPSDRSRKESRRMDDQTVLRGGRDLRRGKHA